MGTSQNWVGAYQHVQQMRLADVLKLLARHTPKAPTAPTAPTARTAPDGPTSHPAHTTLSETCATALQSWPIKTIDPATLMMSDADRAYAQQLQQQWLPGTQHPEAQHAAAIQRAMGEPAVHELYFRIRRSLWQWREFAGLRRGARTIIEVVIELARDEAFPWYLPVCAEDVRRLARLAEGSYTRSVRELDSIAIVRQARVYQPCDEYGTPLKAWMHGRLDEVPLSPASEDLPQFLLRYQRGIPWNRKRAAWWINYDLLCGTGRVLPMFVMHLSRLPQLYMQRNRSMGRMPHMLDADWCRVMGESHSQTGPILEHGLRAPRWRLPADMPASQCPASTHDVADFNDAAAAAGPRMSAPDHVRAPA